VPFSYWLRLLLDGSGCSVVGGLGFGGGKHAEAGVQAPMVEPVDPGHGRELDVGEVLQRAGVERSGADALGQQIRASKATAIRYERERPGELVHMDVKKIGRIPDGGGWHALGRDKADRHREIRIGFDYVHSLVDNHSRLAYSEILPDEKGPTCAGFLARAAAYFADRGITRIERVMTDNAWAYRWSLREVVADLGARQVFIKSNA